MIGLSGGTDSVVLTRILVKTSADDPRVELVASSIHEGIEEYRDESLRAVRSRRRISRSSTRRCRTRRSSASGWTRWSRTTGAACACGASRRDLSEAHAAQRDADELLIGHSLDDEAQTAPINLFEGNVERTARHYDASLRPFPGRRPTDRFVPRAKPLRDVPEREVPLYAHVRDLPVRVTECPHAGEAYRGEIRDPSSEPGENHPGTRHSIVAGYEELAALTAEKYRSDAPCRECGSQTPHEVCRSCSLPASLDAA